MRTIARSSTIKSTKKLKQKRAFDAQAFLDSAGVARKVTAFKSAEAIYAQGDAAKSVMYLQSGGVKLTVVNEIGKEAVVAILGPATSLVRDVWQVSLNLIVSFSESITILTLAARRTRSFVQGKGCDSSKSSTPQDSHPQHRAKSQNCRHGDLLPLILWGHHGDWRILSAKVEPTGKTSLGKTGTGFLLFACGSIAGGLR